MYGVWSLCVCVWWEWAGASWGTLVTILTSNQPSSCIPCGAAFFWKAARSKDRRRWAWMQQQQWHGPRKPVWGCDNGSRWRCIDSLLSVQTMHQAAHEMSVQVCACTLQLLGLPWQRHSQPPTAALTHVCIPESAPQLFRKALPRAPGASGNEAPAISWLTAYRSFYLRELGQGFYKEWVGAQRAWNSIRGKASVWLNLDRLLNHNRSISFNLLTTLYCQRESEHIF